MRWPSSTLCERLGLDHPIVQAPMASISTAKLVAAVSNAGGLGSLGSAVMSAADVRAQVDAIRAQTHKAFALNFFVHAAPSHDLARAQQLQARLRNYQLELGLGPAEDSRQPPVPPAFDKAMLELVLELRPAAVSFHFGTPEAPFIAALRHADIFVLGTATTVPEAIALEHAGFDAVIAQGIEAGGHRGTFTEPFAAGEIGLLSLLPQVAAAVRVPVLAAGGIADGRAVAAALLLGAKGVQLGTAFLASPEAAIDPLYRALLLQPRAAHTRLTRSFTGRPARAIVNRFVEEMAAYEHEALDFPLQRGFTGPLAAAASAQGNPEFSSLWAGQSAALLRPLPASTLLHTLVEETERALAAIA